MDYLVSQYVLFLAGIGLLGLILGWWLGRTGTRKSAREQAGELEGRLAVLEDEHEQASLEVGRLADQLALAKVELEEARESSSQALAKLESAEEELTEEQQKVASFKPLLAKRDDKLETLRGELANFHDRLTTLEDDKRQALNKIESLTGELSTAQARAEEVESSVAASDHQAQQLRARTEEAAAQEAEIERLRQSEEELRQALESSAGQADEAAREREQLSSASQERDRLVAELATLSGELEQVKLERESHDLAASAARREIEALRRRVAQRDDRIVALEDSSSKSELEIEVDSLRAGLSASVRRVDDMQQRVSAAEAARLIAEGERDKVARELESLLSAPLIDVDRMATAKPIALEPTPPDPRPASPSPELLEVPSGAADDLRRIRGIGEVLAETLNALGIYHYGQIANWSESDVQWVAAHIDTFPDRILRDGWREQAAELELEKQSRQA